MPKAENTLNELCAFLGSRIRSERTRHGHTQTSMSNATGIPLRTYKRFEQSGKSSTENLIKIMRVLDRVSALQLLFPPPFKLRPTFIEKIELNKVSRK